VRVLNAVFLMLALVGVGALLLQTDHTLIERVIDDGLWILMLSTTAHLLCLVADALTLHLCAAGRGSFRSTLHASVIGHVINSVTPGGSAGELTKFSMLREQLGPESAGAAVLLTNALMFVVNCIVMTVGPLVIYFYLGARGAFGTALLLSAPVFFTAGTVLMSFIMRPFRGLPINTLRRLRVPVRFLDAIEAWWVPCRAAMVAARGHWRPMLGASLAAAMSPLFSSAELALILWGLGVEQWCVMACVSLSTAQVVALVTFFVPLQAGTAEGGAMLLFAGAGLSSGTGLIAEIFRKTRRVVLAAIGLPWFALLQASNPAARR